MHATHDPASRDRGGAPVALPTARVLRRPLRLPTPSEHVLLLRDGWAATHQRGVYAHADGRRAWWTGVVS